MYNVYKYIYWDNKTSYNVNSLLVPLLTSQINGDPSNKRLLLY